MVRLRRALRRIRLQRHRLRRRADLRRAGSGRNERVSQPPPTLDGIWDRGAWPSHITRAYAAKFHDAGRSPLADAILQARWDSAAARDGRMPRVPSYETFVTLGQNLRRTSAAGLDGVPVGLIDAMDADIARWVYSAFCNRLLGRDSEPVDDWTVSLLRLLAKPGKPQGSGGCWPVGGPSPLLRASPSGTTAFCGRPWDRTFVRPRTVCWGSRPAASLWKSLGFVSNLAPKGGGVAAPTARCER